MHYVTLSRGGSYFFQSLIIRRLFLPIIGLYCVYTINQKTQVLVAWRYEIFLLMFNLIWVVDEVEHLKMNSISMYAHVVFPIFMVIDYNYNKVIHNGQELSFFFCCFPAVGWWIQKPSWCSSGTSNFHFLWTICSTTTCV